MRKYVVVPRYVEFATINSCTSFPVNYTQLVLTRCSNAYGMITCFPSNKNFQGRKMVPKNLSQ